MKKLLKISLVAVLAATPLMANAADVPEVSIVTGDSAKTAAVSYVKGAYNALVGHVNGKADKATTLAGYGITDAYTKTEADGKFLTSHQDISGKADKATTLAGYGITDAYTKSETYSKTEIDGLVGGVDTGVMSVEEGTANGTIKVDDVDVSVHGLGTAAFTNSNAYATAAQGALADSALQKADIIEGTTNGTINVDGTDVSVHGLGTAAFTNSSAYATAAQGALADTAVQSVTAGTTDGTIKVDGVEVAIPGLGAAAFADLETTW